jgi:hypothetical protein
MRSKTTRNQINQTRTPQPASNRRAESPAADLPPLEPLEPLDPLDPLDDIAATGTADPDPGDTEIASPPSATSAAEPERLPHDEPARTAETGDTELALQEIREILQGIQAALDRGAPPPNAPRATESAGRVFSSLDGKGSGAVSAPGVN